MSLKDHQGSAYAFQRFMELAAAEIQRGERRGAVVKWKTAHPAKTAISWMRRRVLRGEFGFSALVRRGQAWQGRVGRG